MTILQAIISGLVEGLTEFLPISSTAHLLIADRLMNIQPTVFSTSFAIYIQLGAILAVAALYLKKLLLAPKKILVVAIAFVPTAIIGLLLYKVVKNILLANLAIVGWSLLIGGAVLIAFEYWNEKRANNKSVTIRKSFIIGVCQALAIIPGVSRSAATILGGLAMDIKRKEIVEFSFLLALPTMAAATGLDLIKTGFQFDRGEWLLIGVGFIAAFGTALLAIRFMLSFIEKHTFKAFGWYRIIVGLAVLTLLL